MDLTFKNGKEDGPLKEYWENGQLRYEGTFKNGERYGLWKFYNSNGKIISRTRH